MAFCVCILYNETHSCFSSASTTDWMYIRGMEIGREGERADVHVRSKQIAKRTCDTSCGKKHSTCECGVRYIVGLICMRSHSHTLRQAHTCMYGEDGQSTSEKNAHTQKPHSFQAWCGFIFFEQTEVANTFFDLNWKRNVDDAANGRSTKIGGKMPMLRAENENKKHSMACVWPRIICVLNYSIDWMNKSTKKSNGYNYIHLWTECVCAIGQLRNGQFVRLSFIPVANTVRTYSQREHITHWWAFGQAVVLFENA